jgi:molybdopterin synthase sulfur carrier subunit
MKITFKLFAGLSEFLPDGAKKHSVFLEVPESCSMNSLIDLHHIPRDQVHLILINGSPTHQSERDESLLKDGDAVAMWPPVAGG